MIRLCDLGYGQFSCSLAHSYLHNCPSLCFVTLYQSNCVTYMYIIQPYNQINADAHCIVKCKYLYI